MEYTGCHGNVKEIIEEASKEFGDSYRINRDKYDKLKDTCDVIDAFVNDIDCECVDTSINMDSKCLSIGVSCDDVVFSNGRTNIFFSLIAMLDSFSFSKSKNGALWIELNIDGLWERTSE